MAYIKKLKDKPRALSWRAQVRRKGHKVVVKMFASRSEAEHWAHEQERAIRLTGLPQTIDDLKKHAVGEIVSRYLKEITPTKGCSVSETTVLKKFLKHKICSKSLAYVPRQDAFDYIADRRKDRNRSGDLIKPSTIRREINSIQHIFELAREQWGFSNLQNPFRGIPIRGSSYRRTRRLNDGELKRLLKACRDCRGLNEYYVPLAISLAIETGMRLQEIFNLVWRDYDPKTRRIEINKSKTDYRSAVPGRTIVATPMVMFILGRLAVQLDQADCFSLNKRIFPMTKGAFQQSWADVRKRAGIDDLEFRDFRHEAGSRFDEAGLTKGEHDLMMGHASRDMRGVYVHADLKSIQNKLDRHALGGRTTEEIERDLVGKGLKKIASDPNSEKVKSWLSGLEPDDTVSRLMTAGLSTERVAKTRKFIADRLAEYKLPSPVPVDPTPLA
jgi:integrase